VGRAAAAAAATTTAAAASGARVKKNRICSTPPKKRKDKKLTRNDICNRFELDMFCLNFLWKNIFLRILSEAGREVGLSAPTCIGRV
jgi:hypothetical protein